MAGSEKRHLLRYLNAEKKNLYISGHCHLSLPNTNRNMREELCKQITEDFFLRFNGMG